MFSDIHHVSYLVPDLDAAIKSYTAMFGAQVTGRGVVPNLGEVAFLRAGGVEVELIAPENATVLDSGNGAWVVHHVAYLVDDLDRVVEERRLQGYSFLTEEPITNFMGYRLIYFDPADTGGCLVHLTDAATVG